MSKKLSEVAACFEKSEVTRALDGIDLVVRRGEILALIGESGSGKTTLGKVITRLTPLIQGESNSMVVISFHYQGPIYWLLVARFRWCFRTRPPTCIQR